MLAAFASTFLISHLPFNKPERNNILEAENSDPSFNPLVLNANIFLYNKRYQNTEFDLPYSAVGRLHTPRNSVCTATVIGDDIILTAAHCVAKDGQIVKGKYNFRMASDGWVELAQSGITHFNVGTLYPDIHREDDWAILRTSEPLGRYWGYPGIASITAAKMLEAQKSTFDVMAITISADYNKNDYKNVETGCRFIKETSTGTLLHNCSGTRGASGSPMFFYLPKTRPIDPYIVALDVAEFRDGQDKSLRNIPYSDDRANVAIPVARFYNEYKAEAARGFALRKNLPKSR